MKTPTIYVVTFYEFNHRAREMPLDPRFLETDRNFVFYLIDSEIPEVLKQKRCILESQIDPTLLYPGRLYLAEWTLLLAEYRHRFCEYPFFMTSSRFFEKNYSLKTDLRVEWDRLFSFFDRYRWGFLPSYDRPLPFVDASSPLISSNTYFTERGYQLLSELYGPYFNNQVETPYTGDFWCNYIGFKDRSALEEYVEYYLPIIDRFFTPDWMPREDLKQYLVSDVPSYRNFKPFTLLLEAGCHQFFFDTRAPYFALNYDGYYEIHEHAQSFARVENLSTADPVQTKQVNGRPVRVTTHPLRTRETPISSSPEPLRASKFVADPILSFKLRQLFDDAPLHLDLDSGRGIPMLKHSFDDSKSVCIDGSDFSGAPVITDVWSKHARQAVTGDSYGHVRITREDTHEPVLFDVITAFNIPELPQYLYGNLVRNILTHLSPQSVVLLNFTSESPKNVDFMLSSFARSGVTESGLLLNYLGQRTWLQDAVKKGLVKILSNSPQVFEERVEERYRDRDFFVRYRESVIAAVELMREISELQPNQLWTNYLLQLKEAIEEISSQLLPDHR